MATKLYKVTDKISTNYEEKIEMLNQLESTPMTMALDDEIQVYGGPEDDWMSSTKTDVNIKVLGDGSLEPIELNQNLGRKFDNGVKNLVFHLDNPFTSGKGANYIVHFQNKDNLDTSLVEDYIPRESINNQLVVTISDNITKQPGIYGITLEIAGDSEYGDWKFKSSEIELEALDSPVAWSESCPVIWSEAGVLENRAAKDDIKASLDDDGNFRLLSKNNLIGYAGDNGVRRLVFDPGYWTANILGKYEKLVFWQKDGRVVVSSLAIGYYENRSLFTNIPAEVTQIPGEWQITIVCDYGSRVWVSSTVVGVVQKA